MKKVYPLLLVGLVIVAVVIWPMVIGEPATDATDGSAAVSGVYENETGTIEVTEATPGYVHISGISTWSNGLDGGINTGDLDVTVPLRNRHAVYTMIERINDSIPCVIDFDFSEHSLEVNAKDVLGCGWGFNVDFSGSYDKAK